MQQDTNTTFENDTKQQASPLYPDASQQQQNYQYQQQPYGGQQNYPQQPVVAQIQAQPTFGQPFPQGALQQEIVVTQMSNPGQSQMLCNQSRFPISITCPYCLKSGTTRIEFKMGSGSWCCCFILWLFLCCVCCIPCFNDKCQDANHYCPNCGQIVGQCQYKVCT